MVNQLWFSTVPLACCKTFAICCTSQLYNSVVCVLKVRVRYGSVCQQYMNAAQRLTMNTSRVHPIIHEYSPSSTAQTQSDGRKNWYYVPGHHVSDKMVSCFSVISTSSIAMIEYWQRKPSSCCFNIQEWYSSSCSNNRPAQAHLWSGTFSWKLSWLLATAWLANAGLHLWYCITLDQSNLISILACAKCDPPLNLN